MVPTFPFIREGRNFIFADVVIMLVSKIARTDGTGVGVCFCLLSLAVLLKEGGQSGARY